MTSRRAPRLPRRAPLGRLRRLLAGLLRGPEETRTARYDEHGHGWVSVGGIDVAISEDEQCPRR